MNLKDFFELRRISAPSLNPDGSSAVFVVSSLNSEKTEYKGDLWQLGLAGDREPYCVHSGEEGASSPQLDADGTLYFLSKVSGEDNAQVGAQVWKKASGQEAIRITDEPLGVSDYRIASGRLVVLAKVLPDVIQEEQRALYHDREKNGPSGRLYTDFPIRSWDHWTGGEFFHLMDYGKDGSARRDLCPGFRRELSNDHGLSWDLSRDGKTIATDCLRPGLDRQDDSSILLIDVESAKHRQIGVEDRLTHSSIRISPDGTRVAAVQHRREHKKVGERTIAVYSLQDGSAERIAEQWRAVPNIEGWQGNLSLLVTTPDNGHVPLFSVNLDDQQVVRVTAAEAGGTHGSVSCVSDVAVGVRHSFSTPPELFSVSLVENSQLQMLTTLSGMDEISLAVQSKNCEGDGGTPVQYFFLSGDNSATEEKVERPMLFWIHGGPVSSWTDGWHWRWNPLLLIEEGYNLALPNPRGSTGFGQEFIEGISGNQWGGACYRDLMAVCDELSNRPDVDSDKMVAMGGSFGGYMSNWIGTQSDRFAAIITHASLYRLSAFQGTTDFPAYWAHDMGLYPSDAPDEFDRYSPHRFVDNWKSPVLIIHGEKDYRVPISEGLMLFEDLKRRGVDASLLVFPTENHWIVHPRNAQQWYQECLRFLDSRLS